MFNVPEKDDETSMPAWMQRMDDRGLLAARNTADLLPTLDPAVRQRWCDEAEAERPQGLRDWWAEYRDGHGATVERLALRDLSPSDAWVWFRAIVLDHAAETTPAGSMRLVLVEKDEGEKS